MENKNTFSAFIKANKYFILPYLVLCFLLIVSILIFGNRNIYLFLNQFYSPYCDFLFLNLSHLGDGATAFLIILVMFGISFREAFTLLLITLVITILVFVIKTYLFYEVPRPLSYFEVEAVRLVPGYDPPKLCSFPSGHTATAFSVFLYLSILIKQNYLKVGLLIISVMIGYSRVYLSAHFPADILGGSLLAFLITSLFYIYSRTLKISWIDQNVLNIFHKTSRKTL